ncbi:helix-turn-helix domain-containing protein [Streptomyces sp. 4N124]|uniref:helix-turn-helix domain-containing protein n=1 Tax=Streptomyces sp. 4N124 TaxID=3457420 RepID=UPI003FD25AA9
MSNQAPNQARVIPLRPPTQRPAAQRPQLERPSAERPQSQRPPVTHPETGARPASARPLAPVAPKEPKEPLWRDLVGDVLRRERLAQERTLKDVADAARISMPYLSEVERGRKEASSEVLAAAAHALGLGLGDLLSLAQSELTRSRTTGMSPYNGLCLAA